MFLSPDDLAMLTGRRQKRRQIAQLRAMGIPFHVNASGVPIVAETAVQGGTPMPAQNKPAWQPRIVSTRETR